MLLYHGTSASSLELILKQGVLPRARSKRLSNFEAASHPELVYLSDAYAPYFAAVAAREDDGWAVIEVEVALEELLPDEDFIEQALRKKTPLSGLLQRTALYREAIYEYRHHAKDSLERLGNVATDAELTTARIRRAVVFDCTKNAVITSRVLDPQISPINYQLYATVYRALTRWFFEPVSAAELTPHYAELPAAARSNLQIAVAKRDSLRRIV
jgi:hypothetical protein